MRVIERDTRSLDYGPVVFAGPFSRYPVTLRGQYVVIVYMYASDRSKR